VFNNELIFQRAAMAIEKLMVGVFQYYHQMPFDHTLDGKRPYSKKALKTRFRFDRLICRAGCTDHVRPRFPPIHRRLATGMHADDKRINR
jgi:hypothetical protein